MDITSFVVHGRDKALLYGDYSTYHGQLAKRLLNTRKRLGIATKNRGKFRKAGHVTAGNMAQNHEYAYLLLLTSERAWAQAMSMKSAHAADQKGIVGRTRSHILSRLEKAARTAEELVRLLSQSEISGATTNDILEARAYASLIRGAMQFEKHSWEPCLRSYSTTRVIYNALATAGKDDVFKDLHSETVDPSIRYAAYQLKTSRTIPIAAIARSFFPRSDDSLVQEVSHIDPSALAEVGSELKDGVPATEKVPKTLSWRAREVPIEDAQIATTWSSVGDAKEALAEAIAKSQVKGAHEVAAAYDEILMATQDAVDATKEAIDDLKGEGIGQSDSRMQRLQITRTAVNYEMISWRIGRNRVLTGPHDGATEEYGSLRRKKKKKKEETPEASKRERELPPSKKLAKLKEKVALYDGTLQNLESIKELPGVAADEELAAKIDSFEKYFMALKHLAIARSHAVIGNTVNALALIDRSLGRCQEASSKLPKSQDISSELPLSLDVAPKAIDFLGKLLDGELQRHRAIVYVDRLRKERNEAATAGHNLPLIDRLHEYPAGGVDLNNIVEFPPRAALIPVKPIFLDVAWNYISYPGEARDDGSEAAKEATKEPEKPAQQPKKSWFGFGR